MTFLLDTNVVSEWTKARPDANVVRWLAEVDEDRTFLSVITLGELRAGVDRLAASRRRDRLDRWLRDDLRARFEGRVLDVDNAVSDRWGYLLASAQRGGRPVGVVDAMIAATAATHSLSVVTRNVRHFDRWGVHVLNPWKARSG